MGLLDFVTDFFNTNTRQEEKMSNYNNGYMWMTTSSAFPGGGVFPQSVAENEAILYDVYMVYAESMVDPIVERVSVIAKNDDDAKIKSGLMKKVDEKWDTDYLTFVLKPIGRVAFKKKPSEVKVVT